MIANHSQSANDLLEYAPQTQTGLQSAISKSYVNGKCRRQRDSGGDGLATNFNRAVGCVLKGFADDCLGARQALPTAAAHIQLTADLL